MSTFGFPGSGSSPSEAFQTMWQKHDRSPDRPQILPRYPAPPITGSCSSCMRLEISEHATMRWRRSGLVCPPRNAKRSGRLLAVSVGRWHSQRRREASTSSGPDLSTRSGRWPPLRSTRPGSIGLGQAQIGPGVCIPPRILRRSRLRAACRPQDPGRRADGAGTQADSGRENSGTDSLAAAVAQARSPTAGVTPTLKVRQPLSAPEPRLRTAAGPVLGSPELWGAK